MTHDEFDDPRQGSWLAQWFSERKQRLVAVAIVFVLVFSVGVMLFIYVTDQRGDNALMIVSADQRPYKTVPTDPGGMPVPNRDSTVFDALHGGKSSQKDERSEIVFAPEAESVPLDRTRSYFSELQKVAAVPEPLPESPTDQPSESVAPPSPAPVPAAQSVPEEPEALPPSPSSLEPPKLLDAPTAPSTKPVRTPLARDPDQLETAAGQASAEAATGSDYIQLASLPDESAAHALWPNIQAKFSDVLSGAGYRVVKADIPGKGVFYRVQAGPFSRTDAIERCESIKARAPGACMLAR